MSSEAAGQYRTASDTRTMGEHEMNPVRISSVVGISLLIGLASAVAAQQGPPANKIYAHDRLYTGVNTPTDLPAQGLFNAIYPLRPGLDAVSEAAPGDPNYRGGRWEVHPVTFLTIAPRQFTNAEDIVAAAVRGEVRIEAVAKRFECPLIPINSRP